MEQPYIQKVAEYLSQYPNKSMNAFTEYLVKRNINLELPQNKIKKRDFLRVIQNKMKYYNLIEETTNPTDKRFSNMSLTALGQDLAKGKTTFNEVVKNWERDENKKVLEYEALLKQSSDYRFYKRIAIWGLIFAILSLLVAIFSWISPIR